MKRWLYAHHNVHGDPATLEDTLRRRLREALLRTTGSEDPHVGVDGSFTARLGAVIGGRAAHENVRVRLGVAERNDRLLRIPVQWHAARARRAFPAFEGTIELEALSRDSAQLVVAGAAVVPLGPIGAVLDTMGLDRVAERTVQQFVEGLAAELEEMAGKPAPRREREESDGVLLRVADVMTRDPLVLSPEDSLRTAARMLYHHGVSGAPVVDRHGGLVGVISERDLMEKEARRAYGWGRRVDESERKQAALTVADACSRPARTTVPDVGLHDVARAMLDGNVGRLVVVDHSTVAGIVTRHDVLAALVRSDDVLQALVDVVLADLEEGDVGATVEWGVARLQGVVTLRSRVPLVAARVAEIDGILSVDRNLAWKVDDVIPTARPAAG